VVSLVTLKTRGATKAVYMGSRDVMRKAIPQDIDLPKNRNITLIIILLKIAITNTSRIRTIVLSNVIFLDNFLMIKFHRENNRMFIPNIFAPKTSIKIPAKILKPRDHFDSKDRLARTTNMRRRSGFTPNILK
jgi:hypothetical protein